MNSIYLSKTGDGYRNLAADEYILERYRFGELSGITLYFFINSAAVIIGRNQNAWRECNIARMERDGVQLVRRHTGGGAVFHDGGNLNFSFITNEKLYDKERFNRVIVSACRSLGIDAEVNGRNDITVSGRKFSGCAYGLSGVARAMHGTMLVESELDRLKDYLSPSKKKLSAKGVSSVRSRVANLCEFAPVTVPDMIEAVRKAFVEEFGPACELTFSPEDEAAIDKLSERGASWEWRFGCTPEFNAQIDERFSFGELQLALTVKNGVVKEARAFTDALDTSLPESISRRLVGCRYDASAMAEALKTGGAAENELAAFVLSSEDTDFEEAAERARRELYLIPELAFCEEKTKEYIKDFIRNNTDLELHDEGLWLYAAHREGANTTVAVRADFDAVPFEGEARHLCGHNGHTAALLGLALLLKGKRIGKNVLLLFQPAEETGAGAEKCEKLFEIERVDFVIGAHNIPGRPIGELLFRRGTFACASCGLEVLFHGLPTHAAYPENGINPTEAVSRLALALPASAREVSDEHGCMTLSTVVGMRTGERAFGVAASEGALWATLRSERTSALDTLAARVKAEAERLADEQGLSIEHRLFDVFPATENDDRLMDELEKAAGESGLVYEYLEEPFRWSEDFGHYGRFAPAAFFGVGSGEDTAPLHTIGYEYPEKLAAITARRFFDLLKNMGEN